MFYLSTRPVTHSGVPSVYVLRNMAKLRALAKAYDGNIDYHFNEVRGWTKRTNEYWNAEMRRDGTLTFRIGFKEFLYREVFELALKEKM